MKRIVTERIVDLAAFLKTRTRSTPQMLHSKDNPLIREDKIVMTGEELAVDASFHYVDYGNAV